MIDRSFIEKIEEMSKPVLETVNNRIYSSQPLHLIKDPEPKSLVVKTLTSLADYLNKNPDSLTDLIIHIASPTKVDIYSSLETVMMQRYLFLEAFLSNLRAFLFGQWISVEQFIIAMQSYFVQDEETEKVIRLVGNLTDGKTTNFSDDGVTQQVTAKAGIARVENVPVPNPVILAPYRTFLEVDQPKSKFIFRIKSQNDMPTCALFEADGGAWELEAIKNIKVWLEANLPEGTIILA